MSTASYISSANVFLRNGLFQETASQRNLVLHLSKLTQEEQAEATWLLDYYSNFPKPLTTNPFVGCENEDDAVETWSTPFAQSIQHQQKEGAELERHKRMARSLSDSSSGNRLPSASMIYPDEVQRVIETLHVNSSLSSQLRKTFPSKVDKVDKAMETYAFSSSPPTYEFDEDDRPDNIVIDNGKIKCATLTKLVSRLTHEKGTDLNMRYVFLLTHHSFTDSLEVLSKLESRYKVPVPTNLSPSEVEKFKADKIDKVQIRVCSVIKNWLDEHWEADWEENAELQKGLTTLIQSMLETSVSSAATLLAKHLGKTLKKKQTNPTEKKWSRTAKFPKSLIDKKSSFFSFERCNEQEFARQMTLKDWERFHAIKPRECLNCNWSHKTKKEILAPNILAMINQFNVVTNWVQYTLVSEPSLEKRVKSYNKMLKIMEFLRDLNNFNSLFAIYCGLTANPVHRLKKTKEFIKDKANKKFLEYKELFKGDKNSRNLRTVLSTCGTPCIPHLGIFLTDLTFTEDGNPDKIDGMINFDKRMKLAERIRWIKQYQQEGYQLAKVDVVHAYMDKNFKVHDADELWQMSRKNEPKSMQEPKK